MAQNHKKTRKYTYDYPENRELGKLLSAADRIRIAKVIDKHPNYIYYIFVTGTRTNEKAIELAKIIVEQKQEFQRLAKAV